VISRSTIAARSSRIRERVLRFGRIVLEYSGGKNGRASREKQVPRSHPSGQRAPVGDPGCARNDRKKGKQRQEQEPEQVQRQIQGSFASL
jgi:hypothetical protein